MEDPWVNAWGDPQKSFSEGSNKPQSAPPITWTSSSNFITDDQTDIAAPSWEPEVGAIWDDSPDLHKDLWARDSHTEELWTTPTLDSIAFAKPSQDSFSEHPPQSPPRTSSSQGNEQIPSEGDELQKAPVSNEVSALVAPTQEFQSEPASPEENENIALGVPKDVKVIEDARGKSPERDEFGTFEVAVDDYAQSDPWATSSQPSHQLGESQDWDSNWKERDEAVDEDHTEVLDEWELAKRQKEVQDRYVPPELLESILHQFEEFTGDYWPEEASEDLSTTYQHRRDDLAEILSIHPIVDRVIPSDLTLPTVIPFTKTFVSKEMVEALKLTKHHFITRNSPLAVYMNTKGSLSWEASIKSKPDVVETDVVPSGWRIVPKESTGQPESTNDTKKKAPGGLLSFFGRKTINNSSASSPSSPTQSSTPAGASPRSSITSPRPNVDLSTPGIPSSMKTNVSVSGQADPKPSAIVPASTETSRTSTTELQLESAELEESIQAPSVVSRFLGRFSRSNRSSTINVRDSLALSSDDLEFLSDIVPSAYDELDEMDQFNLLSTTIRAPPIPTKLPPPLAPPPRAPPVPKPLSPPPSISSPPVSPAAQVFPSARPSSITPSIESQLLDLSADFSPAQPQSRSTSLFTTLAPQPAATPTLTATPSAQLSPGTPSYSHTPLIRAPNFPLTQPSRSLFDDEDFSDFQTSSNSAPTHIMTSGSSFGQVISPVPAPAKQAAERFASFDFDEFVLPPKVPEKPKSTSSQSPSVMPILRSIPPIPPAKPASPVKQPSLHERRLSRQAESHKRTLTLLENAASRGKWPAPPSPLPNAIAPPSSQNAGDHLLNLTEDSSAHGAQQQNTGGLSLSTSNTTPLPVSPPPPLGAPAISVNKTGDGRDGFGLSGNRSNAPPTALGVAPQLSQVQQVQSQAHYAGQKFDKNLQLQQQWRFPSPPTAKPLPSFAAPPTFDFGHGGSSSRNGSRSGTPNIQPPSQQQPTADAFSSLFGATTPLNPRAAEVKKLQNTGSGGGKLSAQDLSFFEGL